VFGLPSGAQENVGGRTERSKEFSLPDGTSAQLLFTHPIHYQDASGQWQDVDLSFHDDAEGGQVMDRHPSLRVRARAGSGALEITDTAGNGIRWPTSHAMSVRGRHVEYQDAQQIIWTYTTTPTGVKHDATVTAARGPHTYRFDYQLLGNQPAFTVDADGNAVSGDWEVPRATVTDANGVRHVASDGGGQTRVTYHGSLIAVSTVSLNTGSGSQNQFICPCSAGGCSACEHEPVFLGTSSPAYTVSRQPIPTCD